MDFGWNSARDVMAVLIVVVDVVNVVVVGVVETVLGSSKAPRDQAKLPVIK